MTYRKRTLTEMLCQAPRVNDPIGCGSSRCGSRRRARRVCGSRRRWPWPRQAPRGSVGPDGAREGGGRAGFRFFTNYESRKGAELERAVEALPADAPRPEWRGGYRVEPDRYEFWKHRENPLHDRFLTLVIL